ncbi:hypothetical protein [Kitasatospora sp. NPDC058190]|uniref:hypothetical protein n=1 Tax=Kitasatospora sp. NPDC058190 TaxID=3346371 RepID=UPI0036DBB213
MLTTMRRLRRECERKLADLPLPDPFTIEGLVAAMEAASGRTIKLVPLDDRGGDLRTACGLRMRADGLSLIFYRPRPTQHQTNHVKLHELVHEWFDHGTSLGSDELRLLLPEHLRQGLVERMGRGAVVQARARYDTREEQEAELSASLIKRIVQRQFHPAGGDMVSLLEQTLSHPVAPPRRGQR